MSYNPVVERETCQGVELDDIVLFDTTDNADDSKTADYNCEHVISPQPVLRVIIDMNDIDEDDYVAATTAGGVAEDVDNDVHGIDTRCGEPPASIDSTSPASQSTSTTTTMKSPQKTTSPSQKMKHDDDEVTSSSSSSCCCENYENSKPNILNVAA